MKLKIYNKEYDILAGEITVRKNSTAKTITTKIHKYLEDKYNCKITKQLVTGTIIFATGVKDLSYLLFGENLPFREYYYQIEE